MTSPWPTCALGDVCDFERGLTYTKTDEVATSSNVVLRANNIDLESGTLDLSDLRHIKDAVVIPAAKRVRLNSILICTASGSRSHLGKVAFVDRTVEAAFGGFMGQITPRAAIDPRFLFHQLMSPRFKSHLLSLTGGTNINNLRLGDVAKFEFSLPPLAEQQRIVTILDKASGEIAALDSAYRANLARAETFWKVALHTILNHGGEGWADVSLHEVAAVESGVGFPEVFQGRVDEALAFFKVGDMNMPGNEIAIQFPRHTVSEVTRAQLGARIFPIGSIIFPKVGGAIATDKKRLVGRRCCVDNNVMGVIPDPSKLESALLHQLMLNKPLTDFSNDAGLPSIRKTTVEAWRFKMPTDLAEQRLLAGRLAEIGSGVRELRAIYERKLALLAELKKSLLARAFSGELTRDPLAA